MPAGHSQLHDATEHEAGSGIGSRSPTAADLADAERVEHAGHVVKDVAVLSDVHGVLPVLDAVLTEPDVAAADWAEAFGDLPGDVRTVVCAHTHMPFIRLVDRRLVVNPGSVGMPYGRPGGAWALLRDGDVTLRRTEIDVDAAIKRIVAESD